MVNNIPFVPSCPGAYSTIQAAVTAANPGDTVFVCASPTPYNEQVTINKQITLSAQSGAILRPSAMVANTTSLSTGDPVAAAIVVAAASGVVITGLTVDGSANGIAGCAPNLMGIFYRNASGTVAFNAVREFRLGAGLEGCQSGQGIYVQSDTNGTSSVTVYQNSVHRFQKNGITGNGVNTTLTAATNVVTGLVKSTPFIAQNGIQIAFDGKGAISGNTITNLVYSPCTSTSSCPASSTGILVIDPGAAVTSFRNNIGTTQSGIYYYNAAGSLISTNNIWDSQVYDGVAVDGPDGDGNTIEQNTVTDSDEAAVWVNSDNNIVRNNTLNEAPIGIWFVSGTGNTQMGNKFYNIPVPVQNPAAAARRTAIKVQPAR